SNVRILREDKSRKSKYLTEQWKESVISRYEARIGLGMQATDADKVYRVSKTHIEVPQEQGALPWIDDLLGVADDGGETNDIDSKADEIFLRVLERIGAGTQEEGEL